MTIYGFEKLPKSRYTLFRQCSKELWLRIYNPDVATEDKVLEARFGRSLLHKLALLQW